MSLPQRQDRGDDRPQEASSTPRAGNSTSRATRPSPPAPGLAPQSTWLYRLVAAPARMRLQYLLRNRTRAALTTALFVFFEGATALGIITAAAYVLQLPLLFPPLGPSAFILFRTPMAASASPRSVLLAHGLALASGLAALHLVTALCPGSVGDGLTTVSLPRILTVALAMGTASVAMIAARCAHPPAAATALIAGMGGFSNLTHIGGFMVAVTMLVAQAWVFNRLLGGLPYPLWRHQPEVARFFGPLAGVEKQDETFWEHLSRHVFERRAAPLTTPDRDHSRGR